MISDLEKSLGQIEKYQYDIQQLKQKLVQEEQLLRSMSPESHTTENVQVRVCCVLVALLWFGIFGFLTLIVEIVRSKLITPSSKNHSAHH